MKKIVCLILVIAISGCVSTDVKNEMDQSGETQEEEASLSKRVYYFQHKLIAKWVFESDGAFFFDMNNRNPQQLIDAASDIINPEYANKIAITPIVGRNAVSIRFPEPDSFGNCYFALIEKEGSGFSYYTYEKTMTFGEEAFVGVVGGWDNEGGHSNYGPRGYKREDEFIEDVLGPK